jgi:hypothetical protein
VIGGVLLYGFGPKVFPEKKKAPGNLQVGAEALLPNPQPHGALARFELPRKRRVLFGRM